VLTEDAMRLEVGMSVDLVAEAAGGGVSERVHAGIVRRIEPAAFTKLSTLGVEEQRVRVAIRFDPAPPAGLGVGFRLQARFTTRRKADALLVPRFSVLERPDGRRVVLVVEDGKIAERAIVPGLESERVVEVVSGLAPDQAIVASPSSDLVLGGAVRTRIVER
jgi:HlyD family secretion protein